MVGAGEDRKERSHLRRPHRKPSHLSYNQNRTFSQSTGVFVGFEEVSLVEEMRQEISREHITEGLGTTPRGSVYILSTVRNE